MPNPVRRRRRLCSSGCRGYHICLANPLKSGDAKPEAKGRGAPYARSVAGDLCLREKERKPVLHPPPARGVMREQNAAGGRRRGNQVSQN